MKKNNYTNVLRQLPFLMDGKEEIKISEIPLPFQQDMRLYIAGHTISKVKDGEAIITKERFREWIKKLWNKGFDYEINLKGI